MTITQKQWKGRAIIHMEGRFDFSTRKIFKEAMDEAVRVGIPIVLDLAEVSFVDSSALGLLVISHQNLKNKQIPFSLVNPQTYVRQVLDLANVAKMIPIYQTLEDMSHEPGVAAALPA